MTVKTRKKLIEVDGAVSAAGGCMLVNFHMTGDRVYRGLKPSSPHLGPTRALQSQPADAAEQFEHSLPVRRRQVRQRQWLDVGQQMLGTSRAKQHHVHSGRVPREAIGRIGDALSSAGMDQEIEWSAQRPFRAALYSASRPERQWPRKMTSGPTSSSNLGQGWCLLGADLSGDGAAWMEVAARWSVTRVRHVAPQDDAGILAGRVW
jgi:hypothetical protein